MHIFLFNIMIKLSRITLYVLFLTENVLSQLSYNIMYFFNIYHANVYKCI